MMENDGTWMEHGLEQIEQVRTDFFWDRDAIRVNLSNPFHHCAIHQWKHLKSDGNDGRQIRTDRTDVGRIFLMC